jgi:spore maturation protein CgeB
MKIVVFGLSVSSSWGNGHATLWRGLSGALGRRGHELVFFERDVPYYAAHRDLTSLPGGRLVLYPRWQDVCAAAEVEVASADVAMVTSYCPDALPATDVVLGSRATVRAFYDLDTPITLARLRAGEAVPYIGARGLADFDRVLSFTGGPALGELKSRLGARAVAPLYGSVDGELYSPAAPAPRYRTDLSYLGTYAEDRMDSVRELFVEPARRAPERRFLIGGAQYPSDFPRTPNTFFVEHVPPPEHPAFYGSSRATLNVTRRAMAQMGFCPSGRLFEAAACGTAMVSDAWAGIDRFFAPGHEVLLARGAEDVVAALELSDEQLARIGRAARERALVEHSADRRAEQLEALLEPGAATDADEYSAAAGAARAATPAEESA